MDVALDRVGTSPRIEFRRVHRSEGYGLSNRQFLPKCTVSTLPAAYDLVPGRAMRQDFPPPGIEFPQMGFPEPGFWKHLPWNGRNNQTNRYLRNYREVRETAMKRCHFIPYVLLLSISSGCLSQIRDEFDDTRVAHFNYQVAKAAYRETAPLYCNVDCPFSFKQGFIAGFIAMMNGANGCPPVFPPGTRICSTAWLDDGTPEDRRNAWYDGYSHGVLAASQTGAADLNRMPARLPNRQQCDPEMLGMTPSELVPIPSTNSVPDLVPPPTRSDGPALPPSVGDAY